MTVADTHSPQSSNHTQPGRPGTVNEGCHV